MYTLTQYESLGEVFYNCVSQWYHHRKILLVNLLDLVKVPSCLKVSELSVLTVILKTQVKEPKLSILTIILKTKVKASSRLKVSKLLVLTIILKTKSKAHLFYKHEEKLTSALIMLSLLRSASSKYAQDILNILCLRKL